MVEQKVFFSYTKDFPRPGESVRGHAFQMGSGGKGANQAVAAARLGAKVQLIARVGLDTVLNSRFASFMLFSCLLGKLYLLTKSDLLLHIHGTQKKFKGKSTKFTYQISDFLR